MSKQLGWTILLPVLLVAMGACTRTSEAKVNVTNTGQVDIKVTIDYLTSTIPVGQRDTFTLSWPGRGDVRVAMQYYPVAQPARSRYEELVLSHGEVLDFNLGFEN